MPWIDHRIEPGSKEIGRGHRQANSRKTSLPDIKPGRICHPLASKKPYESAVRRDLQGLTDGLTARVEVVYKSDKVHYAYLLSRGCGVDGIIDVADMEPISEETLRDFYDSGDRRCVEADMPYICVMEAKIDADVKVVRVHTGKFAVEILKVYWFSFVDTEF